MSRHGFVATDGIVKAYGAIIAMPKAPLLEQWWQGIQATRCYANDRLVNLIVTNNGKVWSYALRPYYTVHQREKPSTFDPNGVWVGGTELNIFYPASYIPREFHQRKPVRSRGTLESGYREPVAWALRDMARRAKLDATNPNALQLNVAYECEAPPEVGAKLPGPCGPIQYTGYHAKVGAYTLDEIHQTVCAAITACLPHWRWRSAGEPPWKPTGLEIMLHSGNRALGLAFAPGTGRDTNKRTISLNDRLFKEYAKQATWRVMVHELCHHYREEALPAKDEDAEAVDRLRQSISSRILAYQLTGASMRDQIRYRQQLEGTLRTHDAAFVRELSKVDPAVADEPATGLLFTEYADPSLIAEISKRKAAKEAKISWDPAHGRLHVRRLKDGTISLQWLPLTAGAWKAPVVKVSSNADVRAMLERVIDANCTVENWPAHHTVPQTVRQFIEFCQRHFGLFR